MIEWVRVCRRIILEDAERFVLENCAEIVITLYLNVDRHDEASLQRWVSYLRLTQRLLVLLKFTVELLFLYFFKRENELKFELQMWMWNVFFLY